MMCDVFDGVFVREFAEAQESSTPVVIANAVAALGVHMEVSEVNIR
jgi:hypothetical protein